MAEGASGVNEGLVARAALGLERPEHADGGLKAAGRLPAAASRGIDAPCAPCVGHSWPRPCS